MNCLDPDGAAVTAVLTIDSVIGDRVVAGMKVDVEGFEIDVLRGCEQALSEHRLRLIQLEWNETSMQASGLTGSLSPTCWPSTATVSTALSLTARWRSLLISGSVRIFSLIRRYDQGQRRQRAAVARFQRLTGLFRSGIRRHLAPGVAAAPANDDRILRKGTHSAEPSCR